MFNTATSSLRKCSIPLIHLSLHSMSSKEYCSLLGVCTWIWSWRISSFGPGLSTIESKGLGEGWSDALRNLVIFFLRPYVAIDWKRLSFQLDRANLSTHNALWFLRYSTDRRVWFSSSIVQLLLFRLFMNYWSRYRRSMGIIQPTWYSVDQYRLLWSVFASRGLGCSVRDNYDIPLAVIMRKFVLCMVASWLV